MTKAKRLDLVKALQKERGGTVVLSFLTSTRPNLEVSMAMDSIPLVHRHLRELGAKKGETRIDVFVHSNGGDGIVPWRLVTLLREYSAELTLLVPHRAFSAATLLALGCDRVLMHPMGTLGPTDPTVANPFNPVNPQNPAQLLGISVEDVGSYISLVKEDVGIRHEDELIEAFRQLADKVHPLALGNVKRSTSQSRMMGAKLLKQRKGEKLSEHEMEEVVDKLTSRLYYHGHPISCDEARDDIGLRFVEHPTPAVSEAMWALYESYSEDLRLNEEFNPLQEAMAGNPPAVPNPPQMVNPGQLGPTNINARTEKLKPFASAYIESTARTDVRLVELEVTLTRDWTGELQGKVTALRDRWTAE